MPQLLSIPNSDFYPDSVEKFKTLLPDPDTLDDYQYCVYEWMCKMFEEQLRRRAIYRWVSGHEGCLWTHTYEGAKKPFMKAHQGNPSWTFCTGVSLELFYLSWKTWMGEFYGSEIDMHHDFIWTVRGHFERWKSPPQEPYYRGAAGGFEALQGHLEERWRKYGESEGEDVGPMDWVKFSHHQDLDSARFGSVVQFRRTTGKMGKGHAAVLIGMEDRGKYRALRVFNSNYDYALDYNFGKVSPNGGIGVTWYQENKPYSDGTYRASEYGTLVIPE